MGYSIPAAMGAKLAAPSKQVLAVIGDGAFQMSMMELATMRQYGINIKIIVMKNGFLDELRDVLDVSGIPADQLELEITESVMIDSAEKALHYIEEIKEMGVKIAIDDFGIGYSSLSYLNRLPADMLKIDKSFIDKMNTSDSSKQYVAAIISIGHIMGFEVISEGVEENEQLDSLNDIGCDFIQGFVWGQPIEANEAESLVLSYC